MDFRIMRIPKREQLFFFLNSQNKSVKQFLIIIEQQSEMLGSMGMIIYFFDTWWEASKNLLIFIWFGLVWLGSVWFYGLSAIVGYLKPNLFLYI